MPNEPRTGCTFPCTKSAWNVFPRFRMVSIVSSFFFPRFEKRHSNAQLFCSSSPEQRSPAPSLLRSEGGCKRYPWTLANALPVLEWSNTRCGHCWQKAAHAAILRRRLGGRQTRLSSAAFQSRLACAHCRPCNQTSGGHAKFIFGEVVLQYYEARETFGNERLKASFQRCRRNSGVHTEQAL